MPERHRRELARARARLQRLVVLAGRLQQRRGGLERQPALDRRAAHVLVRRHQVEAFAAEALHDVEGVAGRRGLVDDEHGRRAQFRRLLVLVGPAAVVGHGLAAEGLRIERVGIGRVGHRRVVDQHQERLALDVQALEVVPLIFRRLHAVADKDDLGVLHRDRIGDVLAEGDDLVVRLERLRAPALLHDQRRDVGGREADERHLLHPRAIGIARFGAGRLELLDQIVDRELLARRSWSRGPRTRRTPAS